jgi:hypothetical protein
LPSPAKLALRKRLTCPAGAAGSCGPKIGLKGEVCGGAPGWGAPVWALRLVAPKARRLRMKKVDLTGGARVSR